MTRSLFAMLRSRLALGALGTALLGCNSLTSVEAPDVRQPKDYTTAAGASALAIGAKTRFIESFSNFEGQVGSSGLIADELTTTSLSASQTIVDRRQVAQAVAGGMHYGPLQTARVNLFSAIGALQQSAPDSTARIGQLFGLAAYTELFFGESFCAGVPFSAIDAASRPVYGTPLTNREMYERAVADFDSALAYGADSTRIRDMAAVGKGRALLNLGRFNDAAAAVAAVPTTYVYQIVPAGNYTNGLYGTGSNADYTIPEQEGTTGINWRTAADPRTPLVNRSPALMGRDGVSEVWQFARYQSSTAPIPLASGLEARLIEAEAALQAGQPSAWLDALNALRTTVPGLAPLADPGAPAARVDLHFRERAFWLFLTGHRHGDLRRLVRQYGRAAESVFPTGPYRDGQPYGTAVDMDLPLQESPNPSFVGCLNRDA